MMINILWFLLLVCAFGLFVVPILAGFYLYLVEKRVVLFIFVSPVTPKRKTELEGKLINACLNFEKLSKVCAVLLAVLLAIRLVY
jgi:hypothetical protein